MIKLLTTLSLTKSSLGSLRSFRESVEDCRFSLVCIGNIIWTPYNGPYQTPIYPIPAAAAAAPARHKKRHMAISQEPRVVSDKNIATGETSQAITPFHFLDNFNFHHYITFITS